MSAQPPRSRFPANAGFSTIELVGAVMIFSAATAGSLYMSKAMHDHQTAANTAMIQNAYSTFQSQVALQGIDPSQVANPLASAIPSINGVITEGSTSIGQHGGASFENGVVSTAGGAQRNVAGSARVDALNYSGVSAGLQSTRGLGIGFAIETAGPAPPASPNAIQLAPPSFNVNGDLTNAAFPLNNIATLPGTNPSGTVYRYTTDGSVPTGSSPIWDNNPDWTPASFPSQVTLAAFNPDPQYSQSPPVTASYTMQLALTFTRADGRADLYDFALSDLADPADTGIVLGTNLAGYTILYTLDGSDPAVSPSAITYGGSFAPAQGLFNPSVPLEAIAVSNDPRIASSSVSNYLLTAEQAPLTPPSFVTDNSAPLSPGTPVVISLNGGSGSPRTAVNDGAPNPNSSSATSFPLN